MKANLTFLNVLLALTLATAPLATAYGQESGPSSQPQASPSGTPSQGTELRPGGIPDTPAGGPAGARVEPGVGNVEQPVAKSSVGWGWLLLGFIIGLTVGAIAWRRPAAVIIRHDIDRAA